MKTNQPLISMQKYKAVLVALIVAMVVFACGFVWTCKDRIVFDDNGKITEVNAFNNDGSIENNIKKVGIVMNAGDEYRITSQTWYSGTDVKIYHAVPVTVIYQGKAIQLMSGKPTVKELAQSIHTQGKFKTSIDENVRPTAGMTIKVVAVEEKIVEKIRPLKFETVKIPDDKMEKGQTVVESVGVAGSEKATVKEIYEDGVLIDITKITKTEITKPVNQKERVGARDTVETSRGAMRFRETKHMEATAYTDADGPGGGYTAIGMRAKRGVVAVDPNVIPLGTRLYVEGYGFAIAADTGGAIRGNIIDLCMDHNSEAVNFGRQGVKVYILE